MSQSSAKNPYRPGVGTPPLVLAGRDKAIQRFSAVLRAAPELPANMRLTGLRGVGKTVLLHKFSEEATVAGWYPKLMELQPGHNTEASLMAVLQGLLTDIRAQISTSERLKQAVGNVVKNATSLSVTWQDITLAFDPTSGHNNDLAKDLFDTTKLATENGFKGLVLLLDEAQVIKDDANNRGEHPLSMLIACVAGLQRSGVPLGLVVCGLPTLTSNLLRARSYSERMFRGEEIASLKEVEARQALRGPLDTTNFTATNELIDGVVKEVEGYPYFIQLWGAELWDAATIAGVSEFTPNLLDAIRDDIYRRLDLDFYEPRVKTLTPSEQDVLLDSTKCSYPPLTASEMKDTGSKSPGNINVLIGRLVEAGVLYRVRQGQYEYTAPKFRDYLERQPH
ncbi:MAG: ATP-binding protein [Candidatus Saccharibacteria bacterium]